LLDAKRRDSLGSERHALTMPSVVRSTSDDECVVRSLPGSISSWSGDMFATGPAPDPSEDFFPTWSADGSQIAFASERTGNSDLWIIPASGGEARQLTRNPGRDNIGTWSPDGAWIYYGASRSGRVSLWRMPASGTDQAAERFGNWAGVVGWSTDGATMALTQPNGGCIVCEPLYGICMVC
jgi:dipeptidyl aminopeptidase/acylaminoacyl peptidase